MCPIPNLPLIGKNIIIFANKAFYVPIFEKKKPNITKFYFIKFLVKKIRNHGINLPDLRDKTTAKLVGLV